MAARRFELVEGKSSKFWQIQTVGDKVSVTYGRIGTAGQTKETSFPTTAAAKEHAEKLIREKVGKGYAPVEKTAVKSAKTVATAKKDAKCTATAKKDAKSTATAKKGAPSTATAKKGSGSGAKSPKKVTGTTFKDPNFKLAVIQALSELGELEKEMTKFEKDSDAGKYEGYFEKAEGNAWFGAHPAILKYFLSLNLSAAQLEKVKRLEPDGGNKLYSLIAPHWDGEDDLFSCSGVEDAPLLPNLEDLAPFHAKPVKDCSPLLACPSLKRLCTESGYGFADKKTLKVLKDKGVEIFESQLPAPAQKEVAALSQKRPPPSTDRSKPPQFSNPNFKLAVIAHLLGSGDLKELELELQKETESKSFQAYFKKATGAARRGAHPELLKKVLEVQLTWQELDRVKEFLPGSHDSLYRFLAPHADYYDDKDYPFYVDDLQDVVLLQNLEDVRGWAKYGVQDCSPLLECKKLKQVRNHYENLKDKEALKTLKGRGVEILE